MFLGKLEKNATKTDYSLTTLRTFNRRRVYLVWLFNNKFDALLTPKEREVRNEAEKTQFKWNVRMKALSVLILMQLRLFRRPAGRSWLFDIFLLYSGIYSFLLSDVIGVHKTWP